MDKDAVELLKRDSRNNLLEWVKNLLIIEYAEVVNVIDVNTVQVQLLVQPGEISKAYTVRLISFGNTKLKEEIVQPQKHDQVVLLFFRSHNDLMFMDSEARAAVDPDGKSTIQDSGANRYNMFSGVGILASTAKARASSSAYYGIDADGPFISEQTAAKVMKAFKNAVSLVFDSPTVGAEEESPTAPFNALFGEKVPVHVEHRAPVTIDNKSTFDMEVQGTVKIASQDELDLEGATVEIVKDGSLPAARQDDIIQVTIETDADNLTALSAVCSIFGLAFTAPLVGKITGGSSKVKIG